MLYFNVWIHCAGEQKIIIRSTAVKFVPLCLLADLEGRQTIDCSGYEKVCHDVGLRKQHLGYHKSWDCSYFTLLLWFLGIALC